MVLTLQNEIYTVYMYTLICFQVPYMYTRFILSVIYSYVKSSFVDINT